VLLLGIVDGMLFAILLSLAAVVRRMSSQHVTRLGQLGESHNFVDIARHPDARVPEGLAVWRPAEPLFFANAERVFALIAAQVEPDNEILIVSLEQTYDLDSTALDALVEFDRMMSRRRVRVRLARVRDHIRDVIRAAGAGRLVDHCYYSVADAVEAATKELKEDADAP